MRYPDQIILGFQKVGAILALLRLSIFFKMYNEKCHITLLERKMQKFNHTITPLDVTIPINKNEGVPKEETLEKVS